jgi:hypothetical protein
VRRLLGPEKPACAISHAGKRFVMRSGEEIGNVLVEDHFVL